MNTRKFSLSKRALNWPNVAVTTTKNLCGIVSLALTMALLNGCTRFRHVDPVTVRAGEEVPPDFLTGPMAPLLTNVDGFSARLVENTSAGGKTTPKITGELIGRQGRLIFQPTHPDRKLPKDAATGLFFIWNQSQDRGYVLSEELQAYAPISSSLIITNVSFDENAAPSETIQGHPCHRLDVAVTLSNGSTARFAEWQADDLKRFPLRLRSLNAQMPFTVDFSNVRLEFSSPRLFNPPEGFIQYASAISLMNELMIRQSTLKQRPSELEEKMPITGDNSWGANTPNAVAR